MGLFGLSVDLSTCLAAAGLDTTRKLDTGPAISSILWMRKNDWLPLLLLWPAYPQ